MLPGALADYFSLSLNLSALIPTYALCEVGEEGLFWSSVIRTTTCSD